MHPPGQGVQYHDPLRHHVIRQLGGQLVFQGIGIKAVAACGPGLKGYASVRCGFCCDHTLPDHITAGHDCFHVTRIHPHPADFHDEVTPPAMDQHPVFIQASLVTGKVDTVIGPAIRNSLGFVPYRIPGIAEGSGDKTFAGPFRHSQVAPGQRWGANGHSSDAPGRDKPVVIVQKVNPSGTECTAQGYVA